MANVTQELNFNFVWFFHGFKFKSPRVVLPAGVLVEVDTGALVSDVDHHTV